MIRPVKVNSESCMGIAHHEEVCANGAVITQPKIESTSHKALLAYCSTKYGILGSTSQTSEKHPSI